LAFFWDSTAYVGGEEHSVGLFTLLFFLSLVDCTSSVLFVPFMASFKPAYLNSYLIGEGLSGFVPAIAALIQGAGGNPECQEVSEQASYNLELSFTLYVHNAFDPTQVSTFNETTGEFDVYEVPISDEPRFSVEAFFGFLTAMMVVSSGAFLFINFAPAFDDERVGDASPTKDAQEERVQRRDEGFLVFCVLVGLQAYLCFFSNGFFPSIQVQHVFALWPLQPFEPHSLPFRIDVLLLALRKHRLSLDGSIERDVQSGRRSGRALSAGPQAAHRSGSNSGRHRHGLRRLCAGRIP